jgi:hypothetical protein
MEILEKGLIKTAIILGVFFVIGIGIIGYTWMQVKATDNSLSVTGSATQSVVSDTVKWNSSFSRHAYATDLNSGYTAMKNDQDVISKFLKDNGVLDSEIIISPISMQKEYVYDKSGNPGPDQYTLVQNVLVQSGDINKIKNLSTNTQTVINQGVIFSSNAPEYYYSKLPEARITLLPEAMKDAQKRAESIAQSTGKKVGFLKSASMGVVQVTQPNSIDISDYGNYDTSTIDKQVMITVKASFTLK